MASQTTEHGDVALLLGVPVDDVTMDETVDRIFDLVEHGRRHERTHQVATVNVDFVVNAIENPELGAIMRRTSLSIPDGMPIVWGARLIGAPLRTRVAGADLVSALVERAASTGAKVALFGAAPSVAQRAADKLRSRFPGAILMGDQGPMFRTVDELSLADLSTLRDFAPDICCVAFGNPKQEFFIDRFGGQLGIPVMIGVGGSLDFIVGEQQRAPVWMQRSGLEWIHRAATERHRLPRRYLHDAAVFIPRLARQVWSGRSAVRRGQVTCRGDEACALVIEFGVSTRVDNRTASEIAAAVRRAWRNGDAIEVRGADPAHLRSVPGIHELVMDAGG